MNVAGESHGSPGMFLTSVMRGDLKKLYEAGAKEYKKANMRIQVDG